MQYISKHLFRIGLDYTGDMLIISIQPSFSYSLQIEDSPSSPSALSIKQGLQSLVT